ncbi:MAG: LysM peptidoglycan-binding domain-containing protein [Eubacterium sp.]|jgi:LysM domain.|nr:LysM peptidoglycan-binding domain-containing protein [Eubacterium sp.]
MEIIYKNDTEEEIAENVEMPKNFRQIGSPLGKSKLYIEDYVATYLKQLQKEAAYGTDSAVLLGKIKNVEQGVCVFVSAAVPIEKTEQEEETTVKSTANTCFNEEAFTKIYQVMKEYFTDIQIVGWVQMVSSLQMQITPKIAKTHRQFFPGKGKVFWMLNLIDKEEKVYLYQKGELTDLHGYYIYYEKNQQMQEYMVSQKEKNQKTAPKEIVDDNVTKNYRQRMTQAKPGLEKRGLQVVLYAASAGVMAAVCILGVSMLNNYESMKQMQNAIAVISNNVAEPENSDAAEKETDQSAGKKGEDSVGNAANEKSAADTAGTQNTGKTAPPDKSNEAAQDTSSAVTAAQNDAAQDGAAQNDAAQDGAAQNNAAQNDAAQNDTAQNDAAQETSAGTSAAAGAKNTDTHNTDAQETSTGTQDAERAQDTAAQEASASAAQPKDEVQVWLDQGYYIVQAGENLESICRKIYKTTAMLDKLCEVNNIQNIDIIYAGQKLVLP